MKRWAAQHWKLRRFTRGYFQNPFFFLRMENVSSVIMLKRERILEDVHVYPVNSSPVPHSSIEQSSNLHSRDRIRKPDATIQRGNQIETRANAWRSTAKPYARSDPKVFRFCGVENPKTIVSSQVFPFLGISRRFRKLHRDIRGKERQLFDRFFLSNHVLKLSGKEEI